MTAGEAAGLAIVAGALADSHGIFWLDLGPPVRVLDLARRLSLVAACEVAIDFVGLRAGERLHRATVRRRRRDRRDALRAGVQIDDAPSRFDLARTPGSPLSLGTWNTLRRPECARRSPRCTRLRVERSSFQARLSLDEDRARNVRPDVRLRGLAPARPPPAWVGRTGARGARSSGNTCRRPSTCSTTSTSARRSSSPAWPQNGIRKRSRRSSREGTTSRCHGYEHRRAFQQTPEEFRNDVVRCLDVVERICGVTPIGYRAPWFSITRQSLWAHDILRELGFRYDSSLYDSPFVPRRIRPIPTSPFRIGGGADDELWEFPIAVWRRGRAALPLGGGAYWRAIQAPRSGTAWSRSPAARPTPSCISIHTSSRASLCVWSWPQTRLARSGSGRQQGASTRTPGAISLPSGSARPLFGSGS